MCTYLNMLGYNAYTGMNAVTDNAAIFGANHYSAPSTNYPVVYGSSPA